MERLGIGPMILFWSCYWEPESQATDQCPVSPDLLFHLPSRNDRRVIVTQGQTSISGMMYMACSGKPNFLVLVPFIITQLKKISPVMNVLSVVVFICFSNRKYHIEYGNPFLESYWVNTNEVKLERVLAKDEISSYLKTCNMPSTESCSLE